jgi:hypothetical protein
VLEGERGGLPVYCSANADFRIAGRAIPRRLVMEPAEAGLSGAEIHWVELRPEGNRWRAQRLDAAKGRWQVEIFRFSGGEETRKAALGTARFAASIDAGTEGARWILESPGFRGGDAFSNPEAPSGFRVTKHAGDTLPGRAMGFARLPVDARATDAHLRAAVAIRPVDLVLGAYEELGGQALPTPRSSALDSGEWSWLFELLHREVRRRRTPGAPFVSSRGRGVPWAGPEPPRGRGSGEGTSSRSRARTRCSIATTATAGSATGIRRFTPPPGKSARGRSETSRDASCRSCDSGTSPPCARTSPTRATEISGADPITGLA